MTASLIQVGEDVVGRADAGEQVEVWLSHSRDLELKVFEGAVDSISSAEPRGAGVRILKDGRTGFAFTTDLTPAGLDEVVAVARTAAEHVTPDDATRLAPAWDEEPIVPGDLEAPGFLSVTSDEKVAFAIELEKAAKGHDRRIRTVEEAGYSESWTEIALASSSGIGASYVRSDAWCYVVAIATDGESTEVGFDFDLARELAGLDPAAVVASAGDKAVRGLGGRKIASARMPVILDPYTAGQLLGVFGSVLTGEAIQKGRSMFTGKLGERVAGSSIQLIDDGRAPGAPGSAPWDAEGVPTRSTPVIEEGHLRSFLYDLRTGAREGVPSTGNASRAGFRSAPHPSPSNMYLTTTGETPEEILVRAGKALLVENFHGVHSGANPVTGDFSVGVTGRLVSNGSADSPVKEVTIAAPLLDILGRIAAVGNDRRWLPFGGSFAGATLLIEEMTVAGS